MRTLILSLSLLLVFLDVLVVGDPDIDRTFGLFKKKKEKVKDKIKKPKYNPCSRRSFLLADEMDDIQDRTFKLFHKKKEKIKEDKKKCEGYRRTFHKKKKKEKKPSYKPRPSYRPPSYHPPQPAHFGMYEENDISTLWNIIVTFRPPPWPPSLPHPSHEALWVFCSGASPQLASNTALWPSRVP